MKLSSNTLLAVLAVSLGLLPFAASAAINPSLTITVTPPLYQVTQISGSDWHSQLKVVNSNPYDIAVEVKVQDFHPDGETGNAVFEDIPKGDANDTHRMSGWIEVPTSIITIKHGLTAEIPFTIHVPPNADPGGHYGALIVSTHADDVSGSSGAAISSGISSLIFLRVPGDVIEKGSIRDFYSEDNVVDVPSAHFILRFENEGNVHLVPQGIITISNMWGKERGKVNINESSTFGNVLPASTRKFEFKWNEVDPSPFEVGRYKAVASIVYGLDARTTVERVIYFWIIPWKPVSIILGSLLFFIWFITYSLRRFVRKALEMERERLGMDKEEFDVHRSGVVLPKKQQPELTFAALKRPLREGITLSAKNSPQATPKAEEQKKQNSTSSFIVRYRPLIVFAVVFLTGISLITWYFVEVFQDERAYHIEQIRPK